MSLTLSDEQLRRVAIRLIRYDAVMTETSDRPTTQAHKNAVQARAAAFTMASEVIRYAPTETAVRIDVADAMRECGPRPPSREVYSAARETAEYDDRVAAILVRKWSD
jgi:hypothetical protein